MGSAGSIRVAKLEPEAPLSPPSDALVVYVLNVGDGDAIVLQFPDDGRGHAYGVVDSNDGAKSLDLLQTRLQATKLRFVCATHPHIDHVRGIEKLLKAYDGQVEDFWDSGFRYTSRTYNGIVKEIERQGIQLLRPTSGFETFIGGAHVTVLSPSIMLRNRYDTYGVDPNNASIVLRLEYPYQVPSADFPAAAAGAAGAADEPPRTRSIILGGDAQTDAWSRVIEEFPHLDKDPANWARQINVRQGRQPLACDILKVSHHCSKHGVNLELVERMGDTSGAGPTFGPRYLLLLLRRRRGIPAWLPPPGSPGDPARGARPPGPIRRSPPARRRPGHPLHRPAHRGHRPAPARRLHRRRLHPRRQAANPLSPLRRRQGERGPGQGAAGGLGAGPSEPVLFSCIVLCITHDVV